MIALAVLVAGCGSAVPVVAVPAGPVATVGQYATIISRYARPLRADAAALATCAPTSCAARTRQLAARAGSLSAALEAANHTGSATYIGAPPHEIAALVADTRYDAARLAVLSRAPHPHRPAIAAALADLTLELDAWTAYGA